MKFTEKWLKEWIDPGVSIDDLTEKLTSLGLEVEGVEDGHIIDVAIPPNRGDCLSILGLARELGCAYQKIYQAPEMIAISAKSKAQLPISIQAASGCSRYVGRVIKGVDLSQPAPNWMQEKLLAAGIQLISPVVDITNYVMLELGQPMHAFDLNKISEHIEVRFAKAKEFLVLLDGKKIELFPEDLVIADKNNALALAGVMGGLDSSVTHQTQDIFLESAYFDPIGIRLSARRHGLQTDSSYRFERGVDYQLQEQAIERATQLIVEITGGVAGPVSMVETGTCPKTKTLSFQLSEIERLLGVSYPETTILDILQALKIQVIEKIGHVLMLEIPSFRFDLEYPEDIVEEIARMVGLDSIPAVMPSVQSKFKLQPGGQVNEATLKQVLVQRGYYEAITYSFIDPDWAACFSQSEEICLKNPISQDLSVMRSSLVPGLLKALQHNQNRQQPRIKLFEVGLVFQKAKSLQQIKKIAGVAFGARLPENWGIQAEEVDFFDLKADVQALSFYAQALEFLPIELPYLQRGKSAQITKDGYDLGIMGAIDPMILKRLDIRGPVYAFELALDVLNSNQVVQFQPVSKFPAIRRDLALLVDIGVSVGQMCEVIRETLCTLLQDIIVFDVYQGKNLGGNKKSIGIGLILQHPSRTLIDNEVNESISNLTNKLEKQFKAKLRD